MTDDIVLRVDRASAEDLYEVLWLLGEHIAAGGPHPGTAGGGGGAAEPGIQICG
ncbi:hypothetical protein ACFYWX_07885 [Streptomyces sp. NPDC002888]|uniref:hypothetical protein n=1 Tax=Streptomyces sp. NPDC002888 TaxID=3364668 RepID=UPI0036CA3083